MLITKPFLKLFTLEKEEFLKLIAVKIDSIKMNP